MAESYVRVAPDSTGKYIRNQNLYVPVDLFDGTGPQTTLVQQQVVQQADRYGKIVAEDLADLLSELLEATRETRDLIAWSMGLQPSADGSPQTVYLQAIAEATVARGEAYQPIRAVADRLGRQVTTVNATREMVNTQTTTISASTSETTIVTASPGFNDIYLLLVSNTSASTNTRIDFRDTTGGTVLFSLQSVGGAAPVGFALPVPIPQTTVAQAWTAQCATSTTDIRIFASFVTNR